MSRAELFPDHHAADVAERVEAHWDLRYLLPMPTFPRLCVCAIGNPFPTQTLVVKDWKFHDRNRTGTAHPWRCDVRLKCVACSLVLTYGVRVPADYHARALKQLPRGGRDWISWREGRRLLAEAGYFEEE